MAVKQLQGRLYIKNVKMVQHRRSQFFRFHTNKHDADIQIYRNFRQWTEVYEGHSPIIKAAKMLYNTTILRVQIGEGVL